MLIRAAYPEDAPAIWAIVEPIIRAGETYTLDPGLSKADALIYWLDPAKETFVCEADGMILSTYYMRPNQSDNGSHVCNCGFMTSATATGRGVARHMCEHARPMPAPAPAATAPCNSISW